MDINNQYTGTLFGKDRQGHITPDMEATESFRPWLPVIYPAPYLPGLRRNQAHPMLAQVALSSQMVVGLDKSGAIVPAGLICGDTGANANHATGGGYCVLQYNADDVAWGVTNPQTGVAVQAAGEYVVLAAPSVGSGVAGDVVTLPSGATITITAGDLTVARACNLFPGGVVRPIGAVIADVYQFLGGVQHDDAGNGGTWTTGGIKYFLDAINPIGFKFHNFMQQYSAAVVQTTYVLRVPWIGALPTTIPTLLSGDGVTALSGACNYGRSFVHFTGTRGSATNNLFQGALVVPSRFGNGADAGCFQPYDPAVNSIADICGRVLGIIPLYPVKDYMNRVRSLWDPTRLGGPIKDPNPASIMMGGSATAGMPYDLNLITGGAFKLAQAAGGGSKLHPEYYTYVMIQFKP
jgi:hypothetical protein